MQFNLAHEDRWMVEWKHVLMQVAYQGVRLPADNTPLNSTMQTLRAYLTVAHCKSEVHAFRLFE